MGSRYDQPRPRFSEGERAVLYVISFLFSLVGIVIGLVYYFRKDEESRHVGKMCLLLGALNLVAIIGISFLLHITLLSWA